ncbi:MAG: hypothetical protein LBG58_03685 [Planctomycetaceae bacterium]|nr:hypothetical protein [Planctomycetaceae bacterium]
MEKIKTIKTLQAEVKKTFKLAETYLKQIELLGEGLSFPVINELRYAGFHVLHAVSGDNDDQIINDYREALEHCRRAVSDAVSLRLHFYINEFAAFEDAYERVIIDTSVIPSYLQDRKTIKQIRNRLFNIKPEDKTKEQHWQELSKDCDLLKNIFELWDEARPNLNKKLVIEQRNYRIQTAILILTFIGLIFAIMTRLL